MGLSTRTLRAALLLSAIALVAVLLGFFWYAHNRAQHFLGALPRKLGADIKQETNGFTYSQSLRGQTIFTVHAAREVQHVDGTITLHDVGIVLYGRNGAGDDRIHGNEFAYDQKNGVLTAAGEVFIDLQAPAGKTASPIGTPDADARLLHVKTSGLVFRQKERIASTDNAVEFRVGGINGKAVGARYDAASGTVVLRSAVQVSGLLRKKAVAGDGQPMLLNASYAMLDRTANVVRLEQARYVAESSKGEQTASAEHTLVHLREGGVPTRVESQGHVTLSASGAGTLAGDRLDLDLNATGQPREAHLTGGVRYANKGADLQEEGSAEDLRVSFDQTGRATQAWLTRTVRFVRKAAAGERQLVAERVSLGLGGGGAQKIFVRSAEAAGERGAQLQVSNTDRKGLLENTRVTADVLRARFSEDAPAPRKKAGSDRELSGLDGIGHTLLERTSSSEHGARIVKDLSAGNVLKVDLRRDRAGKMELARIEQHGGVTATHEAPGKAGPATSSDGVLKPAQADVEHTRSDTALYEADSDSLTLTGSAELLDSSTDFFADKVRIERTSGDVVAQGTIRVSYLDGVRPGEPFHVTADRAFAHKASGAIEFVGREGAAARMWQAGSQVEASVIDFNRNTRTVAARAAGPVGHTGVVQTLLAGDAMSVSQKKRVAAVKITSQTMNYSEQTRRVQFAGAVRVTSRDGLLEAQQAVVDLSRPSSSAPQSPDSSTQGAGTGFMGGRVERVTGKGAVMLTQPGRKATGEQIVYTAKDQSFVLTGTNASVPRLEDEARGTVSGASLRFRSGDDSVVISGGEADERVRSETRIRR